MRDSNGFGRKPIGYVQSILRLIGHLVGTAAVFAVFMTLAWALAYFLHWLNAIHAFPEHILDFIELFEIGIVYLDAGLCAIMLSAGAYRFCLDLKETWR